MWFTPWIPDLKCTDPDIIVLHLGTNDFDSRQSISSTRDMFEQLFASGTQPVGNTIIPNYPPRYRLLVSHTILEILSENTQAINSGPDNSGSFADGWHFSGDQFY